MPRRCLYLAAVVVLHIHSIEWWKVSKAELPPEALTHIQQCEARITPGCPCTLSHYDATLNAERTEWLVNHLPRFLHLPHSYFMQAARKGFSCAWTCLAGSCSCSAADLSCVQLLWHGAGNPCKSKEDGVGRGDGWWLTAVPGCVLPSALNMRLKNLNLADAYCSSEEDIEPWREKGLSQAEDLREKIKHHLRPFRVTHAWLSLMGGTSHFEEAKIPYFQTTD